MLKKSLSLIVTVLTLGVIALFVMSMPDIDPEDLKQDYTNDTSQFMELMGMPVHFRDEGSGPAIVLLHGTGASLHTWDAWTEELKKNFRVIRMDLPAFGLTGPHPANDYSIEMYTSFLDAFLNGLEVDSFTLAGNSLGGRIAWGYAAMHPDKVRALVLIAPSGAPSDKKSPLVFKLAQNPVTSFLLKRVTPRSFIRKNLREVYFDDSMVTYELVDRYYKLALREGNRQAFVHRARTKFTDQTIQLTRISAPTLLVWGVDDQWISPEDTTFFKANIPHAKVVILPEAGHVPMEEVPSRSLAPVIQFLADISPD